MRDKEQLVGNQRDYIINILAAIVTFNPNVHVLNNSLAKLVAQNMCVLIVDNASNNISEIKNIINLNCSSKIYLLEQSNNLGIALALNIALKYAELHNYTWLLTLDQDSMISDHFIVNMYNSVLSKNIGIIYPVIFDKEVALTIAKSESLFCKLKYGIKNYIMPKLDLPITSGSMINVSVGIKIGGFCDELFIDGVDFDFALKMYEHGYSIVGCPLAKLYHNLGKPNTRSIFGIKIMASGHSPQRCYYMNRNAWYLIFHHKKFWRWTLYNLFAVFFMGIRNAVVSRQYYEYIRQIFKGQYDGMIQLLHRYRELDLI